MRPNPEKDKATRHAYYLANKEAFKARDRKWRAARKKGCPWHWANRPITGEHTCNGNI